MGEDLWENKISGNIPWKIKQKFKILEQRLASALEGWSTLKAKNFPVQLVDVMFIILWRQRVSHMKLVLLLIFYFVERWGLHNSKL